MSRLRVLIACEYSGRMRRAFRSMGHIAYSCDMLPAEDGSRFHIQGDALETIQAAQWDLIVAHPPCTDLAVSGSAHFAAKIADGRQQRAAEFFMALAGANAPHIAIENPVGVMSTKWRKPDQIIQPYDFGEDASKKTCWWLKDLPKLTPTQRVPGRWVCCGRVLPGSGSGQSCSNCGGATRTVERWANQTGSGQNNLSPSEDRWKERSRTYQGIADACAAQWSRYITEKRSRT